MIVPKEGELTLQSEEVPEVYHQKSPPKYTIDERSTGKVLAFSETAELQLHICELSPLNKQKYILH